MILEACVDSTRSAMIAVNAGADRVELCANLVEGGTTPSAGSIEAAVDRVGADVMAMIRPRGGDFVYSEGELEIMERDIEVAKRIGATGVVFGCLTPTGDVDQTATERLIKVAWPMSVTFHRAFDLSREPFEALECLVEMGATRILTSGQQPTAPEALPLLADLVQAAGDRIIVMPGVGIDASNIAQIVEATGADEFHVYTEHTRASPMEFRNEGIPMGRSYEPDEYVILETDGEHIKAIAAAIKGGR